MEEFLIQYNALVEARVYCRSRMSFPVMFRTDINILQRDPRMTPKLYEVIKLWKKEHPQAVKDNSNSAWSKRVAKYSSTHHAARTHVD